MSKKRLLDNLTAMERFILLAARHKPPRFKHYSRDFLWKFLSITQKDPNDNLQKFRAKLLLFLKDSNPRINNKHEFRDVRERPLADYSNSELQAAIRLGAKEEFQQELNKRFSKMIKDNVINNLAAGLR